MDNQLMKYLYEHINHVALDANVQMNDIFEDHFLNND
jgi:hypothetical protein